MKNKLLNLKNMKETIVNYSGDQKEFDKIWDSFYIMACTGFITRETWEKFFNECHGWYIEETETDIYVLDDSKDGAIVWRYTGDAEYKA